MASQVIWWLAALDMYLNIIMVQVIMAEQMGPGQGEMTRCQPGYE